MIRSTALQANLASTAVEVVIPDAQKVLLETSASRFGVQQETEKLLIEINHSFVGWTQTLEDLHYRAMGDFYHHNIHDRGAEAIAVFCALYRKVAEQATPKTLRPVALRYWFYYLEKVLTNSCEFLQRNYEAITTAVDHLGRIFEQMPEYAIEVSPRIKRLARTIAKLEPGPLNTPVTRLLQSSLAAVYRRWLGLSDPIDWVYEQVGRRDADPTHPALRLISHVQLRHALEQATGLDDTLPVQREILDEMPDNGEIVRAYINAADCMASTVEDNDKAAHNALVARIRWLIRVLGTQQLASVHEMALRDINRSYTEVMRSAERPELEAFVRETFATLQHLTLRDPTTMLDLIATIGQEVVSSGDPEWVDLVVAEILQCKFHQPEFSGFTEEWQPRINPAHLRNIRTYLRVIEGNPWLARRMIAALVVHLKIGGVFMADTDLFQKDISSLLSAPIQSVYPLVKQLLKLFPVYFNDIGAEGEIRDVSTRLDEITNRQDLLCHFLRKQCHVESNPLLLTCVHAVAGFWLNGNLAPLAPYIPASLFQELSIDDGFAGPIHQLMQAMMAEINNEDDLLRLPSTELKALLDAQDAIDTVAAEKLYLLYRLRELIAQKYELDHTDIIVRLRANHRLDPTGVDRLEEALAEADHEAALDRLLTILEQLKTYILMEAKTEAIEDIYHKRHVAVGIPSMYGRYREEKFEAMGLTFRVESLANITFDKMIAGHNLAYVTEATLQRVLRWLLLLLRASKVDGFRGQILGSAIKMFQLALDARGFTVDQYVNIFQNISNAIKHLIRVRFLDAFEGPVDEIAARLVRHGEIAVPDDSTGEAVIFQTCERILRDIISTSLGLRQLDSVVGRILHTLSESRENLDRPTLNLLMSYDVDRCFVAIDAPESALDSRLYLGNKGHMIRRLARANFPIPPGFILTTELFRCRPALFASDEASDEHVVRIRSQLRRLEKLSRCKLGDSSKPLLLSVRSGAAMSMPGMLDTFLNVGINPMVAEALGRQSGSPWAAWDAYRRFLQFWGMSFGLDRDLFDALMADAKNRGSVEKKTHFSPESMREIACRYRELLQDHQIAIIDDPFAQLQICIDLVLRSWDSKKAQIYRKELQIASDWGTAVIVQKMIYGNLSQHSGTGVALTRAPRQGSQEFQLYGDFIIQGQGDDVVSGLVETQPITEAQRLHQPGGSSISLEKDFPAIYERLCHYSGRLIKDMSMHHQEIEFTFDGETAGNLHILQSRDHQMLEGSYIQTFVISVELEQAKIGSGIGAGSGALCGRVAHCDADIRWLKAEFPNEPIILIRPDTVPDDINMILSCQGLLTAVGGATSHAAVAAQRLGLACVVGCRLLHVNDRERRSELAGHQIESGDYLSINGFDGSIYRGKHPISITRTQSLLG